MVGVPCVDSLSAGGRAGAPRGGSRGRAGTPVRRLIGVHASGLRSSPVVTAAGAEASALLSASVLVEAPFGVQGLGSALRAGVAAQRPGNTVRMSYRLHVDEALGAAVGRSASEELTAAAHGLVAGGSRATRETAVHEARKSIKKTRSLLRLVRGAVKKGLRQEENAVLRDAAGRLAAQRDAAVLVATARKVPAADISERSLDALHQRLVARRREATLAVANETDPATRVSATLTDAARRLARLPVHGDGFEAVLPGLDRAYGRGRKGSGLQLDADGDAWHEWRKHAKDLRYHLEWLTELWPGPLSAAAEELHHLTDLLGDEHDLAVLATTVDGEHERFRDLADLDRIHAAVAARRQELRAAALDLGVRCYAESPKAFAARLEAYWHAGRERGPGGAAAA